MLKMVIIQLTHMRVQSAPQLASSNKRGGNIDQLNDYNIHKIDSGLRSIAENKASFM
jgi:hypothetical protein